MSSTHPVSKPFAGYEDHSACVRDNPDKEDPDAFCAWLAEQAKDALSDPNAETVLTGLTTEFVSSVDEPAQDSEWLIFKDADTPRRQAAEAERPYVFADREDVAEKAADVDVRAENEDGERQIAYAAVLIPNKVDKQGDVIPPYVVERAAHEYMAEYRKMDSDHDLDDGAGVPVESWIAKDEMSFETPDGDTVTYPPGTWIIGKRFADDEWERVKAGELTGFSIYGGAQAVAVDELVDTVEAANQRAKGVDAGDTSTHEMKDTLQAAYNSDTPTATFVDRVQDGVSKAEIPDEDAAMVVDMLRGTAEMLEDSMNGGNGGGGAPDEDEDDEDVEESNKEQDDDAPNDDTNDTNMTDDDTPDDGGSNDASNGDGDDVADSIDELKSMVKGVDEKVDTFDDRLSEVEDEVDTLKSAIDDSPDNDRMDSGDVDDDVPENERMKSVAKEAATEAVAAVAGVDGDDADDPEVVRKGLQEQVGAGAVGTTDHDLPDEDYSNVIEDANDTGVEKSTGNAGTNGNPRLVGGED